MMTTIYERYLRLDTDRSLIGLSQGNDENHYFCTPEGASIIGWAGVDGIHFCFIRGFGEMVFSVSPMNTPDMYVRPLARNFGDFLRLLLACGHTAALEQVWGWEQEQFDAFLLENAPVGEQSTVLHIIQEKLSLAPVAQPFSYIRELQDGFDYRLIPYTKDYYDLVSIDPPIPEWKVYFDASFWGHSGRERPGTEIPLNRQFFWEDEVWTIPAIYTCGKGLIVDFCMQVPPERIRAFMDKWKLSTDNDGSGATDEQRMQIEAENPLAVGIQPKVVLNGTALSSSHGCGLCWNPCAPGNNGLEAWCVMRHYGLDFEQGYVVWRSAFPWDTKRKPHIKMLDVTMVREPVSIPGPRFRVSLPGDHFEFTHPVTGKAHTLTVQEYERQVLSTAHFNDHDLVLPRHYTMMRYALSPDLQDQAIIIADCAKGDRPRKKRADPNALRTTGDVCIGAIGGADGPTAIFIGGGNQGKTRAACSALHFEPTEAVEWRITLCEKTREDMMVALR